MEVDFLSTALAVSTQCYLSYKTSLRCVFDKINCEDQTPTLILWGQRITK